MNSRRSTFNQTKVREAMGLMFDFEWANRALFNGAYQRATSFYPNSDFSASGIPQGHEWYSPRRLGNLRTLLVDEYLDVNVQRHFDEVATGHDMESVLALLKKVPDVPPDPGDEIN